MKNSCFELVQVGEELRIRPSACKSISKSTERRRGRWINVLMRSRGWRPEDLASEAKVDLGWLLRVCSNTSVHSDEHEVAQRLGRVAAALGQPAAAWRKLLDPVNLSEAMLATSQTFAARSGGSGFEPVAKRASARRSLGRMFIDAPLSNPFDPEAQRGPVRKAAHPALGRGMFADVVFGGASRVAKAAPAGAATMEPEEEAQASGDTSPIPVSAVAADPDKNLILLLAAPAGLTDDPEGMEKIAWSFMQDGGAVQAELSDGTLEEGVLVESEIARQDREGIPAGSWILGTTWSPKAFEEIKSGVAEVSLVDGNGGAQ